MSSASLASGVLRRHWLVAVLLMAGAVARLLVLVTFRLALEYLQDSYDYLLNGLYAIKRGRRVLIRAVG